MRSKRPTTYRKWLRERHKVQELGAKAFMTDRMAQVLNSRYEVAHMMASLLAPAFARVIYEDGYFYPLKITYERERDACLRGFEHVIMTEHFNEMLPEQYMIMAFDAWNKAYGDLFLWERKTLWEYLTYWFTRTWQSGTKKFKINQWRKNGYDHRDY